MCGVFSLRICIAYSYHVPLWCILGSEAWHQQSLPWLESSLCILLVLCHCNRVRFWESMLDSRVIGTGSFSGVGTIRW